MYRLTIKRQRVNEPRRDYEGQQLSAPETVAAMALALLGDEDQEVFCAFFLDIKNRVAGYAEVARGSVDSCPVDPRMVFRAALLAPGCASVILCHNHPSGDPQPSAEDRGLTARLKNAGSMLGMPVLDHVIVGGAKHYSFAERG